MIDGIILDVDGTLWDSTEVVAKAWQKAIDKMQMKTVIDVTPDNLKMHFGKTMEVIAEEIFPEETKERQRELMACCCQIENDDLMKTDENLLYPGVAETIQTLSEEIPVFIVSNCQAGYIEVLISKYHLEEYITDTECYGNNGYEKDVNIRLLAKRNHLQHPIYVGDTLGDQMACEKAGLPIIYASYGFGECHDPLETISSFEELIGVVQSLKQD